MSGRGKKIVGRKPAKKPAKRIPKLKKQEEEEVEENEEEVKDAEEVDDVSTENESEESPAPEVDDAKEKKKKKVKRVIEEDDTEVEQTDHKEERKDRKDHKDHKDHKDKKEHKEKKEAKEAKEVKVDDTETKLAEFEAKELKTLTIRELLDYLHLRGSKEANKSLCEDIELMIRHLTSVRHTYLRLMDPTKFQRRDNNRGGYRRGGFGGRGGFNGRRDRQNEHEAEPVVRPPYGGAGHGQAPPVENPGENNDQEIMNRRDEVANDLEDDHEHHEDADAQ